MENNFNDIIKLCFSFSDFCRKINLPTNGLGIKKAKKIIIENNLNVNHFDNGKNKKLKYKKIIKLCPVCQKEFKTSDGGSRKRETCSISCSNTFFRSGRDNGNFKEISEYNKRTRTFSIKYREICFENHKYECIICGENKVLDVHHFDGNKFNNSPENLIPICATHHNYLHSVYKDEVINIVINFRNDFIKRTFSLIAKDAR